MFLDVRDFTGFAERTEASGVVAALNRLFEQAVPIIHNHGGRVDKFVGDGLLAVFGAPTRQPDHADQALAAALEIERTVAQRTAAPASPASASAAPEWPAAPDGTDAPVPDATTTAPDG